MNRWNASESILAPVIAAVPPGTVWAGFVNTLLACGQSIPAAAVAYNMKRPGSFKTAQEVRERRPLSLSGQNAKPFTARIRLVDRPKGSTTTVDAGGTLWEIGMTNLKDGLCTPAVPGDFDTAILQVSQFRMSPTGLIGAPQLALFRHLWASAVQATSPDAIVFGGQHHWRDEWWTESLKTAKVAL